MNIFNKKCDKICIIAKMKFIELKNYATFTHLGTVSLLTCYLRPFLTYPELLMATLRWFKYPK